MTVRLVTTLRNGRWHVQAFGPDGLLLAAAASRDREVAVALCRRKLLAKVKRWEEVA